MSFFHFDEDPDPTSHFDADPNPTFHFNEDPNPIFQFDAGLDPAPQQSDANLRPLVFRSFAAPNRPLRLHYECLVSTPPPPQLYFESLSSLHTAPEFWLWYGFKSRFLFGCGSATLAKKIPFFIRMRIRNTGKKNPVFYSDADPQHWQRKTCSISRVSDPHWFNADPDTDPDPAFFLIADPDSGSGSRVRIQGLMI